jgi:hypothetical protein
MKVKRVKFILLIPFAIFSQLERSGWEVHAAISAPGSGQLAMLECDMCRVARDLRACDEPRMSRVSIR